MSETSRPFPDPAEPINWQEMWTAQRAALHHMQSAHDRLYELIGQLQQPAQVETVVLTPQQFVWESRERWEKPTQSIGILNPNAIAVYFSTVGSAAPNLRSPSAPPNSLIVLPIAGTVIEVAADPTALGASTAVCFLLRYFTVQPAFLGKGA